MLDFTDATINLVSLNLVGNKSRGENAIYSESLLELDEEIERALLKFVLSPFSSKDEFYSFSHHDDDRFNEVKNYSESIFNDHNSFLLQSQKIAHHLYSVGTHPNISSGELIVCLFSGVLLDGENINCLGIFKSETKDYFLTYSLSSNNSLSANLEKGAGLNSLDKGALVLLKNNGGAPELLVLDRKSVDTQYWLNSFLNVQVKQNNTFMTESFMNSCLSFSKNKASKGIEKKDLIVLNRYVSDYFLDNSTFDNDEFFHGMGKGKHSNNFEVYVSEKIDDIGLNLKSGFEVDKNRALKINKKIKNIIKLDTKIELKVDSKDNDSLNNIERGYDEDKRMYYYKVYFNKEID